jgi:hypothetical protein
MASILSEPFKELTDKDLKEAGYEMIPWGNPSRVDTEEVNGRTKRHLHWEPEQYCWQLIDNTADYYIGVIYYFPKSFKGYVAPFQGHLKEPMNPAGQALIQVDNSNDNWYQRIPIDHVEDLCLAKHILNERIKELDKEIFDYFPSY